jgi:hypothetical protein
MQEAIGTVVWNRAPMTTAIKLFLSAIAMALGLFVATSPAQAARIWASERLTGLAPQKRALFLRLFRTFGIILFLGGALVAIDSTGWSN